MRRLTFFLCALLWLVPASVWANEAAEPAVDPAWEGMAFSIEDSRCFVGFAPVYLSVSKLKPVDGNLIGTYRIKVPLKTSKNDHGKIVLPLDIKVSELGAQGGVLKGKAHSYTEKGAINDIVCVIIPDEDQAIRLAITTDDRTVKFKSRYSIVEGGETESDT